VATIPELKERYEDLVSLCQPRSIKVTLDYRIRGGIHTSVTVEYAGDGTLNVSDKD